MYAIELDKVTKVFGVKKVLENISLQIEEGKMYAVTGQSGSGKSTLLNIMGGVESATGGSVNILGKKNISVRGMGARKLLRYDVSFLFQNYALSDNDTVGYNLEMGLLYDKKVKDKGEAIAKVLEKVGLSGYEKQKVYTLSGGEQQRIAMARAMLKPSRIVLADEPTGNLDIKNRDVIFELLSSMNEEGKTIIIATHDEELSKRCDAVITLGSR